MFISQELRPQPSFLPDSQNASSQIYTPLIKFQQNPFLTIWTVQEENSEYDNVAYGNVPSISPYNAEQIDTSYTCTQTFYLDSSCSTLKYEQIPKSAQISTGKKEKKKLEQEETLQEQQSLIFIISKR